jgi:hypothetical protein
MHSLVPTHGRNRVFDAEHGLLQSGDWQFCGALRAKFSRPEPTPGPVKIMKKSLFIGNNVEKACVIGKC